MADLIPGVSYHEFLQAALPCASLSEFRSSGFYLRHGSDLERLLSEPRIVPAGAAGRADEAVHPQGLRVIQWNIEKGKVLDGVRSVLAGDSYLRRAHIYCLNEVDCGTARAGGNADVALELARAAGCSFAYVPSYIECTKGVGDDLDAPGENSLGLHGLAILSRRPILEARAAPLPSCFDYFRFEEKRYGYRQVLMVLTEWEGVRVLAATTHLEVRDTPHCRARQMRAVLDAVEKARRDWKAGAIILTGDWNTHTFARGGLWRAACGYLRISRTSPGKLEAELLRPFRREPLFDLVRGASLEIDPYNDMQSTAQETLGRVEEWGTLSPPLHVLLKRLGSVAGRTLRLRLDWIAADGARAAADPRTLDVASPSGLALSDHKPIGADLRIVPFSR